MIVLSLSRKIQRFIGVYRGDSLDPMEYVNKIVLNVIFFLGLCVMIFGSVFFILDNYGDLTSITNTIIIMMAGVSGITCYFGIASNADSITKLYDLLQNLADESSKYHGFFGFVEAEKKSFSLCKWFTMFMMLFFTFGTILVTAAMSILNIYQGNLNYSTWFLPYNIILPIDKSTAIGWYSEFLIQAFTGYEFVMTITLTVTLFGGCSYYIQACLMQFQHMFNELDRKIREKANIESIVNDLFDIIIFHNKVFEVFETVATIYSIAIFFHLISNILFFAAAIYQAEMSISQVGVSLLFNVLCIMEGLSYTFILCYYANLASHSIAEMANVAFNSDWYCQPVHLQKLMVLIIARAQIPNVFMGLKLVYCSLEAFTKLNKTAATYYLMFRNISHR